MVMATQLTDPLAYHAEGAVWCEEWGGLKWVDMLAGAVLSLDQSSGQVNRFETGSAVAAMVRPRVNGGLVIATQSEFTLWGADGRKEFSSPPLFPASRSRLNEGGCDPTGAVICGSLTHARDAGGGEVYRMNSDGSTEPLFGDVTISNGLGFTADGRMMYYVDSRTRRVDVFDFTGGHLSSRRPFVTIAEGAGSPDGLWVDEQDGVWVALFNGAAVNHYNSAGRLQDVIELPVRQVTSCTLGGPNLDTLFITTSRENLAPDDQPLAGSVFFVPDVGVRGLAVLPFAG